MSTPTTKTSGLSQALKAAASTSATSSRQPSRSGSKQNLTLGPRDAYFEFLPAELLENIFSYCPTITLWALTLVNRGCLFHARSQLKLRQPISDHVIGVTGAQYSWMSIFVPPTSPLPKHIFPTPRDPTQPEGDELYDYEPCFEVSLRIRNDAYHKVAGIVWTEDQWRTTGKAFAHYDSQIDARYEKWVLTAGPIARYQTPVEFRAFVTMNGRTTWTSCPNHMVSEIVSESRPVVRQMSRVSFDPTYGLCVEGRIRIWDVYPRGRIFVRYTVDEWQSYSDEPATHVHGREWRFKISALDRPAKLSSTKIQNVAQSSHSSASVQNSNHVNGEKTSISRKQSNSVTISEPPHLNGEREKVHKSVTVIAPNQSHNSNSSSNSSNHSIISTSGLSNSLERGSLLLNHRDKAGESNSYSSVPKRIMFAVKYDRGSTRGNSAPISPIWDNNNNWNYCHQFIPSMRVELIKNNHHKNSFRLSNANSNNHTNGVNGSLSLSPPVISNHIVSASVTEENVHSAAYNSTFSNLSANTSSSTTSEIAGLGVLTFEFECITDLPIEKVFFDLKGVRQRVDLFSTLREKKYPNSEQKGYFLTHTISTSKIRSGRQKATFTVVCNKCEYSKSIDFHVASSIGDFLSLEAAAECVTPTS